ncbi:MAG TPA: serine hydrolase, partial [Gaiellaceae bacterium]|nr:serine hydrolase [Gaiellaceae bacterium]
NVLLERLGFDTVNEEARRLGCEHTEIRRFMISDGPENLTCARDLVRMIVALRDEQRIVDALALTQGSELPLRLDGRHVAVKGGELWPHVYHEVALVDRTLGVAVCSAPAVLPGEVAAVAEQLVLEEQGV